MGVFTKPKTVNKVCLVPVEFIHPNPNQPRRVFNEGELRSLAQSIEANGLLQPITLRREGDDSYLLIAGERRFMACKRLKMKEIPSIICDVTADDAAVLALIENIQRSDLNFIEEASAIQGLIQQLSITQEQAAKRLGRSQSAVANKLRLLKLPPAVRQKLVEAGLTERHARSLLRLPVVQMEEAVDFIIQAGLNVAETESFVDEILLRNQCQETGAGVEVGVGQVQDAAAERKREEDQDQEEPSPQELPVAVMVKKTGRKLLVVKDLRIFTNTISRAIETMKQAGIEACTHTREEDEYIEYIVRIPKESAYRKAKSS